MLRRPPRLSRNGGQGHGEEAGGDDVHLRIKEAGRGLDNGSGVVVDGDAEEFALCVGDDGHDLQPDILRLHVEGKRVGQGLGLARLDGQVILDGREVAQNGPVGGGVVGQRVRGRDCAGEGGYADGVVLVVGHLDEDLCRPAVDEAHAEDVGVGERRLDAGRELLVRVARAGLGCAVGLASGAATCKPSGIYGAQESQTAGRGSFPRLPRRGGEEGGGAAVP